jgi:ABC-type glycerol-3-phosphate transport system permease component
MSQSKKSSLQKVLGGIVTMLTSHVFILILCFTMALPFIWMVLTSFKPFVETQATHWVPKTWQPGNYLAVFEALRYGTIPGTEEVNWHWWEYITKSAFARYYFNSLFIAAAVAFLQVLTSAMAGFAFTRIQWRGRDALFLGYLATMMIPGLVLMIPRYQIMMELGWVDTYAGLIIPAAALPFGTFLMRQFMLTIPRSLDEAAEIDGASKWQVFWDVVLPLARPGLIVLLLFQFIGTYKAFFWPLIMLRSQAKYTLPVGMLFFESSRGTEPQLVMAAVTMTIVPLIIVFVVLQKYLVKGIQLGAVKG